MKTIITISTTLLLASCTTIKTTPAFTIGNEQYEGSQIKYRHGKAIKWRSNSHPQWAKVEK